LLNVGERQRPELTWPTPLYFEGLELHGSWRVKPGAARVGERMMYITQDDHNALHLYWRLDDHNLEDGGQLRLNDGALITSHITGPDTGPGQKGRSKIEVVDWDGDGKLDLILGTAKRGSIPEPNSGLPWRRLRRGERSLQVVFLRNVGSNAAPAYEYPRQFQFQGEDVYLGAHANSPVACRLGEPDSGPHLLIGAESGRIVFFRHSDLSFYEPTDDEIRSTTP
jgi:hypothetical protein